MTAPPAPADDDLGVEYEGPRQFLTLLLGAIVLAAAFFGIARVTDGSGSDSELLEGVNYVSWLAFVFFAAAAILASIGGLIRLAGRLWGRARGVPAGDE